jgi:hypothetical protein
MLCQAFSSCELWAEQAIEFRSGGLEDIFDKLKTQVAYLEYC